MKTKKLDKRTKAYKDSIKEQNDAPSLGGTTETIITEVIPKEETKEFDIEVSVEDSKKRMDILETVPEELLGHLYKIVGCDCTMKAYDYFMNVPFTISRVFQNIINQTYYLLFRERVSPTSCGDCMRRRIKRIREEFKLKIE